MTAYFPIAAFTAVSCFGDAAIAQTTPNISIPPTAPDIIEQTISKPTETLSPIVPSRPEPVLPNLQVPESTLPGASTNPNLRFRVQRIEVLGNTVPQTEITKLIRAYENQDISFDGLTALRSTITQLYIDNGYITSGDFLPNNQILDQGIVKVQMIEDKLKGSIEKFLE